MGMVVYKFLLSVGFLMSIETSLEAMEKSAKIPDPFDDSSSNLGLRLAMQVNAGGDASLKKCKLDQKAQETIEKEEKDYFDRLKLESAYKRLSILKQLSPKKESFLIVLDFACSSRNRIWEIKSRELIGVHRELFEKSQEVSNESSELLRKISQQVPLFEGKSNFDIFEKYFQAFPLSIPVISGHGALMLTLYDLMEYSAETASQKNSLEEWKKKLSLFF
jgi:hypothetical protein